MTDNLLNISVGTYPNRELDLHKEVKLIKAGILYGDKVTLFNLNTNLFQRISVFTQLSEEKQLDFIHDTIPSLLKDKQEIEKIVNFISLYKKLNKIKHPDNKTFIELRKIKNALSIALKDTKESIFNICSNAGLNDIGIAIKNQLLEIKEFDVIKNDEYLVKNFISELAESISKNNTYPLFDFEISDIMKTALNEGVINLPQKGIARGNDINLVYKLFERLPLFENARIDEIIDIRNELSRPLIRFRSSIMKISGNIENEFWDKDFESDIQNIMIQEIEPVILEIEQETNNNKYLKELLTVAVNDYKLLSLPAFGIMISKYSNISDILLETVASAIPTIIVSAKAYLNWRKEQIEIEKNHLFFYYKLKKELS